MGMECWFLYSVVSWLKLSSINGGVVFNVISIYVTSLYRVPSLSLSLSLGSSLPGQTGKRAKTMSHTLTVNAKISDAASNRAIDCTRW